MKRLTFLTIAAALIWGVAVTPAAEAGWFQKKKPRRTEKPDWMKVPQRYAGTPMTFQSGVLRQNGPTGWQVDEMQLQLMPDCLITTEGDGQAQLDAGRDVVIMGSKIGNTIYALSVRVGTPDFMGGVAQESGVQKKTSATNSACGELIKAPR